MAIEVFHTFVGNVDVRYAVEVPEKRKGLRVILAEQTVAEENGIYRVAEWHEGRGLLVFDEAIPLTAGPKGDAARAKYDACLARNKVVGV